MLPTYSLYLYAANRKDIDVDNAIGRKRPRAWRDVKKAMAGTHECDLLLPALETLGVPMYGDVGPRILLAVAVHAFVSASPAAREQMMTAYYEFTELECSILPRAVELATGDVVEFVRADGPTLDGAGRPVPFVIRGNVVLVSPQVQREDVPQVKRAAVRAFKVARGYLGQESMDWQDRNAFEADALAALLSIMVGDGKEAGTA
jgi:hypothetical protein